MVFFQEKQGLSGYKFRGPVRDKHVDYHKLYKITPMQQNFRYFNRQYESYVPEGHMDCDLNTQTSSSVIETNLKSPVVSNSSVEYINRENFESHFKNRPLADFLLKKQTKTQSNHMDLGKE